MSAIFTINTGSPPVFPDLVGQRVEIDHDRELTFPDHDIRYDETIEALGGEKTSYIKLMETWEGIPVSDEDNYSRIQFIDSHLLISDERLCRLRFDFARHVSWVYREINPDVKLLDDAIELALAHFEKSHTPIRPAHHHHAYFKHAIKVANSATAINEKATNDYNITSDHTMRVRRRAAGRAVHVLISTIQTTDPGPSTFNISYMSASSVADVLYPEKSHHSPDWYSVFYEEQSWQIRRLVDVGQSWNERKKWPPLEATP